MRFGQSSTLLGTKVTASDNFRADFKTLSFSQPEYTLCSLLMKGQTPKRQGVQRLRIYVYFKKQT